jgi:quercetin dioxygenase-like cupin family protein
MWRGWRQDRGRDPCWGGLQQGVAQGRWMKIDRTWRASMALIGAVGLLALGSAPCQAQTRTQLQEQPFPAKYDTVTMKVVVDVGGAVAPHTHPGIEMTYVIGGKAVLNIAGQPPRTLAAGDSFAIPPMAIHSLRNVGRTPLVLVATFVVEAGKPLSTPAH